MGTTTAVLIAVIYGAVVVLGGAIAVVFALSTRSGRRADTERIAERELLWLGVVIALLAALLASTIFFVPFGEASREEGARVVNVDMAQFAFAFEQQEIPAGVPIEFRLTSRDVYHGFGIYDDRDRLLDQIDVVPGKTQSLVHTFDRPGTYRVLCLEFCGVGHHRMIAEFQVVR